MFAMFASPARADVVILKNGERLEGKVLSNDGEELVFEDSSTDALTNPKRIPRSEVVSIHIPTKDQVAFAELARATMPGTALDPGDYDEYINARKQFLSEYPYSSKVSEARDQIKAGQADVDRLKAGEAKIDGRWLSAAEIREESYQLSALRLMNLMTRAADEKDLIGALNAFSRLEKEHPNSTIFPEALAAARKYADQLDKLLQHELRSFKFLNARREKLVVLEKPADQARLRAARDAEIEKIRILAEQAIARGDKFPQYSKIDEAGMQKLQTAVAGESLRLGGINVALMNSSVEATRRGAALLEENELQAARTTLENALRDWETNELAGRLLQKTNERIADRQEGSEVQKKAAAEAAEEGESNN